MHLAKTQRPIPATVQLSPQFLKDFPVCPPGPGLKTGLLFGVIAGRNLTVESFEPAAPDFAPRPNLIGWYSFVSQGGLTPEDYAQHNRHFRRASDIALLIKPGRDSAALATLHARSKRAPLSSENCSYDTLFLSKSPEPIQPLTFLLPAELDPALFLQPYAAPEPPAPPHVRSLRWLLIAAVIAGLTTGLLVGDSLHLTLPSAFANYLHSF